MRDVRASPIANQRRDREPRRRTLITVVAPILVGSDHTSSNPSSPVFPTRRRSTRTQSRLSRRWIRESHLHLFSYPPQDLNRVPCVRSIGCITTPKDFAVAGTATDKLYGVAEGLWEPDLVRPSSSRTLTHANVFFLSGFRNQRTCSRRSRRRF